MCLKKIAIVGTGTDVGKTVFSLLVVRTLFQLGDTPHYIKPFQTGCTSSESPDTDAAFIYSNTPELEKLKPSGAILNCHENPKAPYFAARDMGQIIDIEQTIDRLNKKELDMIEGRPVTHMVIEAAGGLLVPLTRDFMMVDFLKRIKAVPVLVAHAGLGTINHTLLSIECLQKNNIQPACVVLMDTSTQKTHPDAVAENIYAIESSSNVKVSGVISFIEKFNQIDPDNQKVLLQSLHST